MGRRHRDHVFMPGKFVFPGGRIEEGDRRMAVSGLLDARCEARLMAQVVRPNALKARALALAAIRETFEETGLMFGRSGLGPIEDAPAGTWTAFAAQAIYPDLEPIRFIARAITPPGRTRRFDTRFFAIDRRAVAHEKPDVIHAGAELDELVWVRLADARALDLPVITRVILDDLAARIEGGMSPFLPVPFYRELRRTWRRELLA
jgi:8-oxo-dGTP pyrophosphatase MutT (NUDIX family)